MTIWNLGSINADIVFSVPHIPMPGETLASTRRQNFLGGKGANMSVAVARAGAQVMHMGAVGGDGLWLKERLTGYGVDTRHVAELETDTAQALIVVDEQGENTIVLHPGANAEIPFPLIEEALADAKPGDRLLFQNEVVHQKATAELAKEKGLTVCYAAAPFDADAVTDVLPLLDFLILNRVEAEQLREATGKGPEALPVRDVIVTLGGDGADWVGPEGTRHFEAVPVEAVDSTGAGDTFTGYVLASLDRGKPMAEAIDLAIRAGALMVTRHGTADVIPTLEEVESAFSGT